VVLVAPANSKSPRGRTGQRGRNVTTAGPGELRCLDRRTAYINTIKTIVMHTMWRWCVPAIRTWSTRWLAIYVTGRLRLASTPRRNGGDDQVSLRHPLTVGRSTYPDSCDTLLVCPETRHCTCHPASPPARARGSKPDASRLHARLTCTPAGVASRGFTRRRALGAPRRPPSRPRPRPRRPV
jgi:hypothetical protein